MPIDYENYKPFQSSLDKGALDTIKNTVKDLVPSFKIKNSGLYGRKNKRMLFTSLQATEVVSSEGSLSERVYSLPDVEMYIDPQSINVSKKTFNRKTLTKGGWVVQFWGHDLTVLTVSATSGYYGVHKGNKSNIFTGESSKTNTGSGVSKDPLKVFEKIKENVYNRRFDGDLPYRGKPIITLVYEGTAYRGYFDSFDYSLDASTPFIINYGFKFNILPVDVNVQDITSKNVPGVLAETFTNPSGSITKFSDAALNKSSQLAQDGVNAFTKKIGIQDYVDTTPSKVVLR